MKVHQKAAMDEQVDYSMSDGLNAVRWEQSLAYWQLM